MNDLKAFFFGLLGVVAIGDAIDSIFGKPRREAQQRAAEARNDEILARLRSIESKLED